MEERGKYNLKQWTRKKHWKKSPQWARGSCPWRHSTLSQVLINSVVLFSLIQVSRRKSLIKKLNFPVIATIIFIWICRNCGNFQIYWRRIIFLVPRHWELWRQMPRCPGSVLLDFALSSENSGKEANPLRRKFMSVEELDLERIEVKGSQD